jgi:hypothetical protein
MNLSSIFALILSNPKAIEDTVAGLINMFKATTAPAPVTVPGVPASGPTAAIAAVSKKPSEAIRALQKLLNQFVKPQPALVEDGWLGAKTEAAIMSGLTMAKPYLSMLGG